jgi:hypothetical protein
MSSTHIFSSISTSRARFLYRSFPSYFRIGISNSQYTIIVRRKHSELRNEVVPSRETGNSHHEGDNEPASRVKEQFDRREKSFRRKSLIFERMTQVASTGHHANLSCCGMGVYPSACSLEVTELNWKAVCVERRTYRLEGGKGREALPILTLCKNSS